MLHGDISNQRDFIIGIRVEDCLISFNKDSVKDKFLNFVRGKFYNSTIDIEVLSLMRYLYEKTSYTVSLIMDSKLYNKEFQSFLDDKLIPYNQIDNLIDSDNRIASMLLTGQIDYYIDKREDRLSQIGSEYAFTPKEFNKVLRRKINR